jgi:putative Mn2+ efflux pump MntP
MSLSLHVHALLLALASSTDNFCVGLSVGVQQKRLPVHVNAFISVCNATGALLASHGGSYMTTATTTTTTTSTTTMAPLFASAGFAYLGYQEFTSTSSSSSCTPPPPPPSSSSYPPPSTTNHRLVSWSVAIPMTLNNLAGGVAGGMVGIVPFMAGGYALAASFVGMWVGHAVGTHTRLPVAPNVVSGALLTCLSALTLWEWLSGPSLYQL